MPKDSVTLPNKVSLPRVKASISGIEIHPNFFAFLDWCDKMDRLTGRRGPKGRNIRAEIQKAINS